MLYGHQQELKADIYGDWQDTTVRNVMPVLPTGGGKTVIVGSIIQDFNSPCVAIAHRQELVSQLALALNREQVPHGLIAPKELIRQVVQLETETHGRSFYHPRAPCRVAGVHTLEARGTEKDEWFRHVSLAIIDEGHHVLKENIWGRALALFPSARGLLPTAHAVRADGAGLGRDADGVVDRLALGPTCRELIDRGFLTDYRLICPPSDIDVSGVPLSASGDFSPTKLRAAVHRSGTIVGDVVRHYLKFAAGKLGVTFAVDIESAKEIAAKFNNSGVPAAVITAETPIAIRAQLMRRFRLRELLQLVSVDVLGEGVDVPAIEVISMARHTASFQLYAQQFGRALRCMIAPELWAHWGSYTDEDRLALIARSVKPHAIVIDHVNNWRWHGGPPDMPREYSLLRRERRRSNTSSIPLRVCASPECLQPYEVFLVQCPYCGTRPEPRGRSTPDQVDGDLFELDPAVLRALRGDVDRVDNAPRIPEGASPIVVASIKKNHNLRKEAQQRLRGAVALWAGWQRHLGRSEQESYRRFFHAFGCDVMSAQALGAPDAAQLEARIRATLIESNVVAA